VESRTADAGYRPVDRPERPTVHHATAYRQFGQQSAGKGVFLF
jgi:hypothetical protein